MILRTDLIRLFLALKEQIRATVRESGSTTLDTTFGYQFNALADAARPVASIRIPRTKILENQSFADLAGQIDFAVSVLTLGPASAEAPDDAEDAATPAAVMPAPAPPIKPRVFIGCSTEGIRYAKLIQLQLAGATHTTIWNQGVFGLSRGTLETLVAECRSYDYAALVLTPDDMRVKREQAGAIPRDNVVFELGLFMGALGRDRVFMVVQQGTELPTDLAGITPATFDAGDTTNAVSALGPVTTKLEIAMGLL
ncbi:TIR domain-containing protein [Winogradskya humida]|uniref:CD-NTase-associated protein 12/Pycsar effector protein TIR domain-containing protein n=1 Tax=Winogradskya humida TaxID=113566 RepID=A0ABQ3ZK11_9ACTN|nr:nucleotide-binding protein [Actinoplanes humidus]GIE18936.1 hypothetical protein Ahu01nite_020380 [Actinoplanes humidus]